MNRKDSLKWLVQEGFLEVTPDGKYRLTEEGEYLTGRLSNPNTKPEVPAWQLASWRLKDPKDWTHEERRQHGLDRNDFGNTD